MDDRKTGMINGVLLRAKEVKGKILKSLVKNNRFCTLLTWDNKIRIIYSEPLDHMCGSCKSYSEKEWKACTLNRIFENMKDALQFLKKI